MKTILAGPWVGEFGWELFCWQGFLRKLSQDGNRIIVSSRSNSKFLYQDFCDEFVPFDPIGEDTDAYKCHNLKGDFSEIRDNYKFDEHLDPQKKLVFFSNGDTSLCRNFFLQKFIKYGNKGGKGYDVIIHARSTEKCGTYFRNWDSRKWENLVELLRKDNLSVASVGEENKANHITGTSNLIGIGLKDLADVFANSKVIMGPSSGPIHYGALCGLSQLVWSESKNKNKYLIYWNPFKVEVTFYSDKSWNPSIIDVCNLFNNHLKNLKSR